MADGFQNEAPVKHGDRAAYPLASISPEPSWGQKTKNMMAFAAAMSLGQNWVCRALEGG